MKIKPFKYEDDYSGNIYNTFKEEVNNFTENRKGNNYYTNPSRYTSLSGGDMKLPCDGLILQPTNPLNTGIKETRKDGLIKKKLTIIRKPLKWKPRELSTIDFELILASDNLPYEFPKAAANNNKNTNKNTNKNNNRKNDEKVTSSPHAPSYPPDRPNLAPIIPFTFNLMYRSGDARKPVSMLKDEILGMNRVENVHVSEYLNTKNINSNVTIPPSRYVSECFRIFRIRGVNPIVECSIEESGDRLEFKFKKFTNIDLHRNILLENKRANNTIVVSTTIAQWLVPITSTIIKNYAPGTEIEFRSQFSGTKNEFDKKFVNVKKELMGNVTGTLSNLLKTSNFNEEEVKIYKYDNSLFINKNTKKVPDTVAGATLIVDQDVPRAYVYKRKKKIKHSASNEGIPRLVESVERHDLIPKFLFKDLKNVRPIVKTRYSKMLDIEIMGAKPRIDITKRILEDNNEQWEFEIEFVNPNPENKAEYISALKGPLLSKYIPLDILRRLHN